jgi:transcriptional regulator with XRE-family HTH domain
VDFSPQIKETSTMPSTTKKPPLLLDFGDCVRQFRIERGFSQEAFADACEIDRSYMGGIERGERNLALVNIVRIIQALELEPSEFFKGLDSQNRATLQFNRQNSIDRTKLLAKVKPLARIKKPVSAL